MTTRVHLDEARAAALEIVGNLLEQDASIERAVVLDDLFGRLRIIVWPGTSGTDWRARLDERLRSACGAFWASDGLLAGAQPDEGESYFHESVWSEGRGVDGGDKRLRLNDRHRNRTAWFLPNDSQARIWAPGDGPPVVVFYSFKGGVGRTTALAAYALTRARRGERVSVVDFDLDAPGVGCLLDADGEGAQARWGVVDFLLEHVHELPLDDYKHTCARGALTGDGVIDVFPAGRVDDDYLTKLARVDFEPGGSALEHPLAGLLQRIRDELQPSVILVDGRAGLSPAAGLLLAGLAHLHVLFATGSRQSVAGLEQVVRRLGYEQARDRQPQNECLVAQAMVPANPATAELARNAFAAQLEDLFRIHYYAQEPDAEDALWSLRDIGSDAAPHVPVPVTYSEKLAFFRTIDEIADVLTADDHARLCAAIDERLPISATPDEA